MGNLGGGAVHGAMGMRVWSEHVGLLSVIGIDFPAFLSQVLNKYFDTTGVITHAISSPRVWLLFEQNGKRNEVFRTRYSEMVDNQFNPKDYPFLLPNPIGVHLQCNPHDIPRWSQHFHCLGTPILLWEPWDQFCLAENYGHFCKYAKLVDIVSPNLNEARMLTGLFTPRDIINSMLDNGVKVIALRMGEHGSVIGTPQKEPVHIPAVPVPSIVDVTGAGNSFCGGFICGMHFTQDPVKAGYYGSISASFSLEQFGAVFPLHNISERANERLQNFLCK